MGGLDLNTREITKQYRLNKWTEIIRECRSSGQTISAWCTDHNISQKSYYYWLRQVRAAAYEALPAISSQSNPIVPVNFPSTATGIVPSNQEISSEITIHFGSISLDIRNNASATLIETTLKALQHVR